MEACPEYTYQPLFGQKSNEACQECKEGYLCTRSGLAWPDVPCPKGNLVVCPLILISIMPLIRSPLFHPISLSVNYQQTIDLHYIANNVPCRLLLSEGK